MLASWAPRTIRMDDGSFSLESSPIDQEKLDRSESEWHDAVFSYLSFRAGCEWRRGKPRYRQSPEFVYYMRGIRLLSQIRDVDPLGCPCRDCSAKRVRREREKQELGRMLGEQIANSMAARYDQGAACGEPAWAPLGLAAD